MATVSFAADVLPILSQYKGQMMWRFDMTSYDQMKANANLILARITSTSAPMPPPPFAPLTPSQINTLTQWVAGGCQP
jgi:hypothetical protein